MRQIIREERTITLDGQSIPYVLQRSSRRKRTMQLQLGTAGGLTLLTPSSISDADIERFFKSNSKWVFKHLNKSMFSTDEQAWSSTGTVTYKGRKLRIETEFFDVKPLGDYSLGVQRSFEGDALEIMAPKSLDNSALEKAISDAILRWYRDEAGKYLIERMRSWVELTGLEPSRIRISNARRRWGSCSNSGSINLSWRLMTLPDELSDYVIVHELAHLVEFNHSARFWELVGSIMPDYKSRRAETRKYAPGAEF